MWYRAANLSGETLNPAKAMKRPLDRLHGDQSNSCLILQVDLQRAAYVGTGTPIQTLNPKPETLNPKQKATEYLADRQVGFSGLALHFGFRG